MDGEAEHDGSSRHSVGDLDSKSGVGCDLKQESWHASKNVGEVESSQSSGSHCKEECIKLPLSSFCLRNLIVVAGLMYHMRCR